MINPKLVKLLLMICAGLCVVIFLEWFYTLYAQKQLLESINPSDKKSDSAAELPTIELEGKAETNYVDLVNRPLFIQGRRPVPEGNNPNKPKDPIIPGTFAWELNGIYTFNKQLYAFFSRSGAKVPRDNFRKLPKDSNLDGWIVSEIAADKVVLTQGANKKELPLRKAKAKDAAKPGGNVPPTMPGMPNRANMRPGFTQPPQAMPIVPGGVAVPEPVPPPEIIEPELIPENTEDPNFENSDDLQEQY